MDQQFLDRRQAGRKLGQVLRRFPTTDPVVLALPRGGVPVGYEVARLLRAPLEVFIVRKIGLPCCREVAMGALASGGIQVLDGDLIRRLQIQPYAVDMAIKKEMRRAGAAGRALRRRFCAAGVARPHGHPGRRWPRYRSHHARRGAGRT